MKTSNSLWKDQLADKMPELLAREIDTFETDIALRKQGKMDERLFAETRLRRGVYGQRYDNGQRHDGTKVQQMAYPSGDLTKGPMTMWDAPGMQRIKIPGGGLNAAQLEAMAELAEEYSDGIAHVTTRQDFQLHYIQIDDTPSIMRRLAAAGITTREACGNSVRNVTACPYAGVCPGRAIAGDIRVAVEGAAGYGEGASGEDGASLNLSGEEPDPPIARDSGVACESAAVDGEWGTAADIWDAGANGASLS